MKHNRVASFLILMIISFLMVKPSFAQQAGLSLPREEAMNTVFNLLAQTREEAIRDSLRQAETKHIETKLVRKERKENPLRKGLRMKGKPYLIYVSTFDDNADSTETNKKSTLTHQFKPGIKMNFAKGGRSLYLHTYLDNIYNFKRPVTNSQLAAISITTGFPIGRQNLSINNDYVSNYISTPELGIKKDQLVYYWKNTFNALLGRKFNRYSFDMGYNRIDLNNEKDANLDNSVQETVALNQSYRILSKTHISWEYKYGRTRYTHTYLPGSQYYSHNLELGKVFSYKLSGALKLGSKQDDYKQGTDSRTTTVTGNLGYRISQRTDLASSYRYLTFEPMDKTNYYVEKTFSLTGNHRLAFNPKFKLIFGYGADSYDYPKKYAAFIQENTTYTFSLGLNYAFRRWLDFSLDYGLTKRKSNVDIDYKKNVITFRTEARF